MIGGGGSGDHDPLKGFGNSGVVIAGMVTRILPDNTKQHLSWLSQLEQQYQCDIKLPNGIEPPKKPALPAPLRQYRAGSNAVGLPPAPAAAAVQRFQEIARQDATTATRLVKEAGGDANFALNLYYQCAHPASGMPVVSSSGAGSGRRSYGASSGSSSGAGSSGRSERDAINLEPAPKRGRTGSAHSLLIFVSNPLQAPLAKVLGEALAVSLECPASIQMDDCTLGALHEFLHQRSFTRFLFSGHTGVTAPGVQGKTLGFTRLHGKVLSLTDEQRIEQVFRPHHQLELIFLNGCNSYELGKKLHRSGRWVVCWETLAADAAASIFARAFFRELRINEGDYGKAFQIAALAILLDMEPSPHHGQQGQERQRFELCDPLASRVNQSTRRVHSGAGTGRTASGVPVLIDSNGGDHWFQS